VFFEIFIKDDLLAEKIPLKIFNLRRGEFKSPKPDIFADMLSRNFEFFTSKKNLVENKSQLKETLDIPLPGLYSFWVIFSE